MPLQEARRTALDPTPPASRARVRLLLAWLLLAITTTSVTAQDKPASVHLVQGQILGVDDKPIAGASIHLVPLPRPKRISWSDPLGWDLAPITDVALRSTRTDKEGRYALRADDAPLFHVAIRADGYAPWVEGNVTSRTPALVTRLHKGYRLYGTVRSLAGTPVEGATVTYRTHLHLGRYMRTTKTDKAGRYNLERLPIGSRHCAPRYATIEVRSTTFAPQLRLVSRSIRRGPEALRPPRELDVYLARGGVVEGSVVDAVTEKPVTGATVVVWSREWLTGLGDRHPAWHDERPFEPRVLLETKTGPEGKFRCPNLPVLTGGIQWDGYSEVEDLAFRDSALYPGGIFVTREGYSYTTHPIQAFSKEGQKQAIQLSLVPGAALSGRVVDGDDQPHEGVRVYVKAPKTEHPKTFVPMFLTEKYGVDSCTTSDAHGFFRFGRIPCPGGGLTRVEVHLTELDYMPPFRVAEVHPGQECRVDDMRGRRVDRTANKLPTGYVHAPDGEPFRGAIVRRIKPTDLHNLDRPTLTAADGWFGLKSYAGAGPLLRVSARGFATQTIKYDLWTEQQITLRPGRAASGTVVSSTGQPVPYVTVFAFDPLAVPKKGEGRSSRIRSLGVGAVGTASCDAQGRFRFSTLGPQPHVLLAETAAAAAHDLHRKPWDFAIAKTESIGEATELRLPESATRSRGTIRILLRDADGKPDTREPGAALYLAPTDVSQELDRASPRFHLGEWTGPGIVDFFDVPVGTYALLTSSFWAVEVKAGHNPDLIVVTEP